mgnify:CR=1 FL=1
MTARSWFRVHSVTGVMAGLILFLVCWSGTTATLSNELDWLVTPEMWVTEGSGEVAWEKVYDAVSRTVAPARIKSLQAPSHRYAPATAEIETPGQPKRLIYVHPRNGAILGAFSELSIQEFFRGLHRHLFLPKPIGIVLVSLFAVALLSTVVAALMFYRRWWTRFFRLRVFARSGRVAWSDLHKTAGLWSLWFVCLIAITGIWYGLEATDAPDALFEPVSARETTVPSVAPTDRLPLGALIARVRATRPGLKIRKVYPDGKDTAGNQIHVVGRGQNWFLRDRVNSVTISANGVVINSRSEVDLTAYEYWVNMADPLHFGSFGGLVSKAVWFVFGLFVCGLILSGTWLHARRLSRSAGDVRGAQWPGTLPACGASVILLAATVSFGVEQIVAYGATHGGIRYLPEVPLGATVFIVGWLVVTLTAIVLWLFILRWPHKFFGKHDSRSGLTNGFDKGDKLLY